MNDTPHRRRKRRRLKRDPRRGSLRFVTVNGRRWEFVFVPWRTPVKRGGDVIMGAKTHGSTDAPSAVGKKTYFREGQTEHDELDSLLHEMLHMADWDKDEEWVTQVAHDMARTLAALGWCRVMPGEVVVEEGELEADS